MCEAIMPLERLFLISLGSGWLANWFEIVLGQPGYSLNWSRLIKIPKGGIESDRDNPWLLKLELAFVCSAKYTSIDTGDTDTMEAKQPSSFI